MLLNFIDKKIQKAFSSAAMQYDILTSLHKEIGRELVEKNSLRRDCQRVLDVGMGTGWLTHRLTNVFEEAKVIGIDFSLGMIAEAQKHEGSFQIVQAHAEDLPFKNNIFDIVISNLAYQWVENLEKAFRECYAVLKDEGVFCCTLFGKNTFDELFHALDAAMENREINVRRLISEEEVKKIIKAIGFKNVEIKSEPIQSHFPDMMTLIKWIKDIGANALSRDFFVGKDLLKRANQYYDEYFKDKLGVVVTFEIIWIEGRK